MESVLGLGSSSGFIGIWILHGLALVPQLVQMNFLALCELRLGKFVSTEAMGLGVGLDKGGKGPIVRGPTS